MLSRWTKTCWENMPNRFERNNIWESWMLKVFKNRSFVYSGPFKFRLEMRCIRTALVSVCVWNFEIKRNKMKEWTTIVHNDEHWIWGLSICRCEPSFSFCLDFSNFFILIRYELVRFLTKALCHRNYGRRSFDFRCEYIY